MVDVSSNEGFIFVPKSMKMEATANTFWLNLEDKEENGPSKFRGQSVDNTSTLFKVVSTWDFADARKTI